MDDDLSQAQLLKFALLADGAVISRSAEDALRDLMGDDDFTPADYASTSGLILRLEDEVWVNMPVAQHNPNFVPGTAFIFDHGRDGFFVHGAGLESAAEFWPPPAYHGTIDADSRPLMNYVVTHGDRVRLSPTIGCAMTCTFCNIPYDDDYAGPKNIDAMIASVNVALADARQPAQHLLISGGTPGPPHVEVLRDIYEAVLIEFTHIDVDIMMVPLPGLFDLPRLDQLGLNEISINLEIYSEEIAADVMRHKHRQGRQYYLDFLRDASEIMGGHRVRSMLMVGLEPLESTLAGVEAIAERGATAVLSPFRPDPVTPLRDLRPPSADDLRRAFLVGREIASRHDSYLGPTCPPCTHNTLNFVETSDSVSTHSHAVPAMASGT